MKQVSFPVWGHSHGSRTQGDYLTSVIACIYRISLLEIWACRDTIMLLKLTQRDNLLSCSLSYGGRQCIFKR